MVRGIHKIPLPKIQFTIYKSINLMYNKRRGINIPLLFLI